jgi:hypothetical protein
LYLQGRVFLNFLTSKGGEPLFETTFNQNSKDNPLLSMGYTDKGATALRIWGFISRGVYMLGKPEYTKVKGLDKKIRLEDSRQFERNGIQDVTQQKLATGGGIMSSSEKEKEKGQSHSQKFVDIVTQKGGG